MKIVLILLTLIHVSAWAQMDEHQTKALQQTQDLLKSPEEREKFLKEDQKAREVDNKVNALVGGSGQKEAIYGVAADIMAKITAETNGDTAKMQKLLEEAQSNPEAFYQKYFDASQKSKVRDIATEIEKSGSSAGPRH
ncbi:MAG: hypothetical protein AB7F86_07620 [Bdellovibrionales bacterium]